MTLSDFLQARIAEDEAVAWVEVRRLQGSSRRGGKNLAARRVAECEAKRRIVGMDSGSGDSQRGSDHDWLFGWDQAHEQVLRLLALPYAQHPDYDPTWVTA